MLLPKVHTELSASKSAITQDPESSMFDVMMEGAEEAHLQKPLELENKPGAQPEGGSGVGQLERMLTPTGQTRGGALWSEGSENRECLEEIVHALNPGQTK